jgi:hypothetical protein
MIVVARVGEKGRRHDVLGRFDFGVGRSRQLRAECFGGSRALRTDREYRGCARHHPDSRRATFPAPHRGTPSRGTTDSSAESAAARARALGGLAPACRLALASPRRRGPSRSPAALAAPTRRRSAPRKVLEPAARSPRPSADATPPRQKPANPGRLPAASSGFFMDQRDASERVA